MLASRQRDDLTNANHIGGWEEVDWGKGRKRERRGSNGGMKVTERDNGGGWGERKETREWKTSNSR